MVAVRTTISLDPDVYSLLVKRLALPGSSMKSVVNGLLRAGLSPKDKVTFTTSTAAMGLPCRDLDHALGLVGELDDEVARHVLEAVA
jgi:hypothetical protein